MTSLTIHVHVTVIPVGEVRRLVSDNDYRGTEVSTPALGDGLYTVTFATPEQRMLFEDTIRERGLDPNVLTKGDWAKRGRTGLAATTPLRTSHLRLGTTPRAAGYVNFSGGALGDWPSQYDDAFAYDGYDM